MTSNPQYVASDGSIWILVMQDRTRWEAAIVAPGTVAHGDVVLVAPTEGALRHEIDQHVAGGQRSNPNVIGSALVYRVVEREGDYYVEGLEDPYVPGDVMLLFHYASGDVDSPTNADMMLGALYDLWQVSDDLQARLSDSGAEYVAFVTPFGRFRTDGVHVVPLLSNPAGLTAKGERMYEHIRESYGRSPRAKEIAARTVIARAEARPELGLAQRGYYGNPEPPQFRSARASFEGFNDYEMREVRRFEREIVVPERMPLAGPCVWVTYRSDKWNDGTHDYIHEISSYPRVKCCVAGAGERTVRVPQRIRDAVTLAQLGKRALGFAFEDEEGNEVEAQLPTKVEWFWSPGAKALYCIERRRKLVALIWGGKLDVEPRGIVG